MKNVTSFDKATLQALRSEMQAVLDKFGSNLQFEVGNMRFSEAEVDIKVKAIIKGKRTRSDSQLEAMVKMLGLKMKNSSGDRLTEYKARNRKYPFIFERNGQSYKCSEAQAKSLFG
jgi:hypothetical protein